jgi:hypothetical protein
MVSRRGSAVEESRPMMTVPPRSDGDGLPFVVALLDDK